LLQFKLYHLHFDDIIFALLLGTDGERQRPQKQNADQAGKPDEMRSDQQKNGMAAVVRFSS
jgi:hypothetical protein